MLVKKLYFGVVPMLKNNTVIGNKFKCKYFKNSTIIHNQCNIPHCGRAESEITFLVEPCSGAHSSFDDREELEPEALEISTGEVFALLAVEMDLL